MRHATLDAVFVGATIWLGDFLVIRVADHGRDPWYWLGMTIFVIGVAVGSYVRRSDPRLPRHLIDERGVTLGVRGFYALPREEWDEQRQDRY
jgi:hypothetical protein